MAEVVPQHAAPAPGSDRERERVSDAAPTRSSRWLFVTLLLMVALIVVTAISLGVGAVPIAPGTILASLVHPQALSATDRTILFQVRLPRVLASGMVGAGLAVAGLLFQGLFRNPMADPYVIGSSGGAVFGAAIGIFFLSQVSWLGFSVTALLAFAGSVTTMAVVYWLARAGRGASSGTNVVTLLLAGFAVSTMLSSSTYFFALLPGRGASGSQVLIAWLHGSIGIPTWMELGVSAALLGLGGIACLPLMRQLNTLALGDEYAQQLGLRVEATRVAIILVGSLLTATTVALGGLIGFAGLVVPHFARLLLGPEHRRLLPVTALGGAIFLMLADTLARSVIAPAEIPVGILMALLGGPFFLYLLRRTRRGYAV